MESEKCKVWIVKCGVWSVKCGVWSAHSLPETHGMIMSQSATPERHVEKDTFLIPVGIPRLTWTPAFFGQKTAVHIALLKWHTKVTKES